jgi:hypothetical protein
VPAAFLNDTPALSSERMLHKGYDCKCSVEKQVLVVSLKELVAKTLTLTLAITSSQKFSLCIKNYEHVEGATLVIIGRFKIILL